MLTDQREFHRLKDTYRNFVSRGSGEREENKVVDTLHHSSVIKGEKRIQEWSFKGRVKFRKTETKQGPKDVFPPATYEIFI